MSQLIVNVVGAVYGKFTTEEKEQRDYAKIHVLEALKPDPTRQLEAIGMRADTYTATAEAYATIRTHKLPAKFICEIETSTSVAKGQRVRIVTAEPFGMAAPAAGGAR